MTRIHPMSAPATVLAIAVLALLLLALPWSVAAAESSDFGGTYQVEITTGGGAVRSTQIGLEELGDGRVEISGQYEGIPIFVTGRASVGATPTETRIDFEANVPLLFEGTGAITITRVNGDFLLAGNGAGIYQWLGATGQGSATGAGRRTSAELPDQNVSAFMSGLSDSLRFAAAPENFPTPSPMNTAAGAGLAAIGLMASGIHSIIRRRIGM